MPVALRRRALPPSPKPTRSYPYPPRHPSSMSSRRLDRASARRVVPPEPVRACARDRPHISRSPTAAFVPAPTARFLRSVGRTGPRLASSLDEARFLADTRCAGDRPRRTGHLGVGPGPARQRDACGVIRAIGAVEGVEWLRVMYVQPDGVTDELLHAMATTPNVCRYLDIPLQHAANACCAPCTAPGRRRPFLELIAAHSRRNARTSCCARLLSPVSRRDPRRCRAN